uniref:F-box domain-containing protein n=1 Tax=Mycena chlorophos TaxID=658473 RepID=A0ABQ0MAN2_MYCCL|nr:predicted protein [Mycena chlorophos]
MDLPPELEREIFELCAHARPSSIPTLMLTAWRVKQWTEPLLYRTIVLSSAKALDGYPTFGLKPFLAGITARPAFFRDSVRNLMLHSVSENVLPRILAVCTRVENLWAPMASDALLSLASGCSQPALGHLYTSFMPLLRGLPPTHAFFARLTHLEIIGMPLRREYALWVDSLSGLPRLTHLAFNEDALLPISAELLHSCELLRVLVSLVGIHERMEAEMNTATSRSDPRFVVLYSPWFEDWQMGIRVGKDYWSKAESIVEARRNRAST